jgi:hypothetical protein
MSATIILGSFIFWSIFIDGETMFNRFFGFVFFPLKLLFFPVSFTWEFRKIWKAHKNRFPIKTTYFFLLVVGLSTALLDTNHLRLGVSEYLLWFCLISTLITCMLWTLNPIRFLDWISHYAALSISMEKDKIVPKSAGKSQKAEWVIEQAKLSLSNYIKMVGWLISFAFSFCRVYISVYFCRDLPHSSHHY